MHAKLMRADRGQALVETVVFLPMFLLALFGVMWAVQSAVQNERVESAVRYNGLVSQHQNPYSSYSLATMYLQLGYTVLPQNICVTPSTAALSDASPTYTSGASGPFWSPYFVIPICVQVGPAGIGVVGIQHGTGLNQDLILSHQASTVVSITSVPAQLQTVLGSVSGTSAQSIFFKPVGINVILACYPTLNTQIQNSLQYTNDTSTAPTTLTALGSSPMAITPTLNTACTPSAAF